MKLVLFGCETWLLPQNEEHRLRVLHCNELLSETFKRKCEGVREKIAQ
jgi:hypothetical protein